MADDGERESFHRSAPAPPATPRPAGHITAVMTPQVTAQLHDFAGPLEWRDSSADRVAARRDSGEHRMGNGEVDRGTAAVPDASLTDIEAGKLSTISVQDIGAHDIQGDVQ